jgi:hypothetical protein
MMWYEYHPTWQYHDTKHEELNNSTSFSYNRVREVRTSVSMSGQFRQYHFIINIFPGKHRE